MLPAHGPVPAACEEERLPPTLFFAAAPLNADAAAGGEAAFCFLGAAAAATLALPLLAGARAGAGAAFFLAGAADARPRDFLAGGESTSDASSSSDAPDFFSDPSSLSDMSSEADSLSSSSDRSELTSSSLSLTTCRFCLGGGAARFRSTRDFGFGASSSSEHRISLSLMVGAKAAREPTGAREPRSARLGAGSAMVWTPPIFHRITKIMRSTRVRPSKGDRMVSHSATAHDATLRSVRSHFCVVYL